MAGNTGGGAKPFKLRDLAGTVTRVGPARGVVVYSLSVVNNTAATAFIQIFNVAANTSVALGTTNPDKEFQVAANATLVLPMSAVGEWFPLGCFAASTTAERGNTGSAAGVQFFASVL